MSILSSVGTLQLQLNQARTQQRLQDVTRQLASGLRVQTPADDPIAYVVATSIDTQVKSIDTEARSLQNLQNTISTASGALGAITGMLQQLRVLALAAASGTIDAQGRVNLQNEATQLIAEIDTISCSQALTVLPQVTTPLPVIQDPTFAGAITGPLGYIINPTPSPWQFVGIPNFTGIGPTASSGIGLDGTIVGALTSPPVGNQFGFVQAAAGVFAGLSQVISGFQANTSYTFSFDGSERAAGGAPQVVDVTLDGVAIGTFTLTPASWTVNVTTPITPGAGSHTLAFTPTVSGGADLGLITNVTVQANPSSSTATITTPDGGSEGNLLSATVPTGFSAYDLGIASIDLTQGDASTLSVGPELAITLVDAALDSISTVQSSLGALGICATAALTNSTLTSTNLTAAVSNIRDVNVATASTMFVRSQILANFGSSLLAQANVDADNILYLFR